MAPSSPPRPTICQRAAHFRSITARRSSPWATPLRSAPALRKLRRLHISPRDRPGRSSATVPASRSSRGSRRLPRFYNFRIVAFRVVAPASPPRPTICQRKRRLSSRPVAGDVLAAAAPTSAGSGGRSPCCRVHRPPPPRRSYEDTPRPSVGAPFPIDSPYRTAARSFVALLLPSDKEIYRTPYSDRQPPQATGQRRQSRHRATGSRPAQRPRADRLPYRPRHHAPADPTA